MKRAPIITMEILREQVKNNIPEGMKLIKACPKLPKTWR
jgi:hypothetical protein